MNTNTENRVQELLNTGFKVSLNSVFGRAGEIFKGIVGYAFLAILIYFILTSVMSFIVDLIYPMPAYDVEELQGLMESGDTEAISQFYIDTFGNNRTLLYGILSNLASIIFYPILYSIFTLAYKYDHHQKIGFEDIFVHYKNGKFVTLIVVTVIVQILASIGLLLCILPGIAVYTIFMLSIPLVIFADADIKESLSYASKLAFKDFGNFFLLCLSFIGIGFAAIVLGIMLCCVGLIATLPIFYILVYVLMYSLYKEVIGFMTDSIEVDQINNDIYSDNPYMK